MAKTNADRQRAYRERLRAAGIRQILVNVDGDPIGDLRAFAKEIDQVDSTNGFTGLQADLVKAKLWDILSRMDIAPDYQGSQPLSVGLTLPNGVGNGS